MKLIKGKRVSVYIRMAQETKEEFLKAVELECSDQQTLGEYLLKNGARKIIKKSKK